MLTDKVLGVDVNVWVFIAIPVAVLVGAATVWATFRAAAGRRAVLRCRVMQVASLVTRDALGLLEVSYNGVKVDSPHAVTLKFYVDSRKDVPSSAFDGNRPVVFDLGANIVSVLSKSWFASGPQKIVVTGSTLAIEPDLLSGHSKAELVFVVDGLPRVTVLDAHVENMDVEMYASQAISHNESVAVVGLGMTILVLYFVVLLHGPGHATNYSIASVLLLILANVSLVAFLVILYRLTRWWLVRRERMWD